MFAAPNAAAWGAAPAQAAVRRQQAPQPQPMFNQWGGGGVAVNPALGLLRGFPAQMQRQNQMAARGANPFGNQLGGAMNAASNVHAANVGAQGRYLGDLLGFGANRENALVNLRGIVEGADVSRREQDVGLQAALAQAMASQYGAATNAAAQQYAAAAGLEGSKYGDTLGYMAALRGYGRDRDVTQMNQFQHALRQARFNQVLPLIAGMLGSRFGGE